MQNKVEVAVYLPDEDVKKWMLFQKLYDPVSRLMASGFFEQKNASITVDFDHLGKIRQIRRADVMYSERYTSKN